VFSRLRQALQARSAERFLGWSQAVNTFTTVQADKLPEWQRGKVGAITGFATMVAPVVGAVVGGMVATQPYLLFLLPGAAALVTVLIFVTLFNRLLWRPLYTFAENRLRMG